MCNYYVRIVFANDCQSGWEFMYLVLCASRQDPSEDTGHFSVLVTGITTAFTCSLPLEELDTTAKQLDTLTKVILNTQHFVQK